MQTNTMHVSSRCKEHIVFSRRTLHSASMLPRIPDQKLWIGLSKIPPRRNNITENNTIKQKRLGRVYKTVYLFHAKLKQIWFRLPGWTCVSNPGNRPGLYQRQSSLETLRHSGEIRWVLEQFLAIVNQENTTIIHNLCSNLETLIEACWHHCA